MQTHSSVYSDVTVSPAVAVLPIVVSPAVAVPMTAALSQAVDVPRSQAADVPTAAAILAARRSVRVAWPSCVLVSLLRSAATKQAAVVQILAVSQAVVPLRNQAADVLAN